MKPGMVSGVTANTIVAPGHSVNTLGPIQTGPDVNGPASALVSHGVADDVRQRAEKPGAPRAAPLSSGRLLPQWWSGPRRSTRWKWFQVPMMAPSPASVRKKATMVHATCALGRVSAQVPAA